MKLWFTATIENMAPGLCEVQKVEIQRVFNGTLVHSTKENALEILENKLIGVSKGGEVRIYYISPD